MKMFRLFNKREYGAIGETAALKYLKKKKYKFVARNVYTHSGEIDLIMQNRKKLLFVEVKMRSPESIKKYGAGAAAVNYTKQIHIIKSAKEYLSKNPTDKECRFDVVEIIHDQITNKMEINHIEDAFINRRI